MVEIDDHWVNISAPEFLAGTGGGTGGSRPYGLKVGD